MTRGYIALARGFFEHDFFAPEPFTEREAFQWMVFEAAWEPRRVRRGHTVFDLQIAEFAHAIEFMRRAWKWKSKSRVYRFLKRLADERMIVCKAERDATHITICNYEKFQLKQNAKRDVRRTLSERAQNELEPLNHLTIEPEEKEEGYTSPAATIPPAVEPVDETAQALAEYNRVAEQAGFPRAQLLTKRRRSALAQRLQAVEGISGWQAAMAKAAASDFLTGRTGRRDGHENWQPDLDWFLKPANFTKLMEGSYDNRPQRAASRNGRVDPVHAFASAMAEIGDELNFEDRRCGESDLETPGAISIEYYGNH